MFAHHVIASVNKEKVDEALKVYKEKIIQTNKVRKGYRGNYLLTNRSEGKIISISLWDSQEDAIAFDGGSNLLSQVNFLDNLFELPLVNQDFEVSMIVAKTK